MVDSPEIIVRTKPEEEGRALYNYGKRYWSTNIDKDLKLCYRDYKRWLNKDKYPLKSKLFPPVAFSNAISVLSNIVDSVYSSRDIVSFIPNYKAPPEHCRDLEWLINGQTQHRDIKMAYCKFWLDAIIYPYSIAKKFWINDENRPGMEALSVWDCFFDPSCGWDIQRAEWFIHRTRKSKRHLQNMVERGVYKISKDDWTNIKFSAQRGIEREIPDSDHASDGQNDMLQACEVREFWVSGRLYTMAGDNVLIREPEEFPIDCYPLIMLCFNLDPEESRGEGLIMPAHDLQAEITNQRNLVIEKATINTRWGFTFDGSEGEIDEERLYQVQTGIIYTNGRQLKPIPTPGDMNLSFASQQQCYSDAASVMGVNEISKGEAADPKEKAVSIGLRAEAMNRRGGLNIFMVGISIEAATEIDLKLNQKFLEKETWINEDGDTRQIGFQDVLGSSVYSYVPVTNTAPFKEIYAGRLRQFYQDTIQDPNVNHRAVLSERIDAEGFLNKGKILMSEQNMTEPELSGTGTGTGTGAEQGAEQGARILSLLSGGAKRQAISAPEINAQGAGI